MSFVYNEGINRLTSDDEWPRRITHDGINVPIYGVINPEEERYRQDSEDTREAQEAARVSNESQRVQNEIARQQRYQQMLENTDQHIKDSIVGAMSAGNKTEDAVYTTTNATTSIPIPFENFQQFFDMLFVDVNGLDLAEGDDYEIIDNTIELTTSLPAGQEVHFRVLRYQLADADKNINVVTYDGLEQMLQNLVFAPYTRTILQNDDNTYTSFQVSTMDEDEQYIFVITPFSSSNQSTTKTSTLNVIDPQTGDIVTSEVMDVGHGRSLTVKNNIMLTSNQYAETNNEWVAIDISNKTSPQLVTRGNFNGRHIFWTDDGAACYTGTNTIKFFRVEKNSSGYPTAFIETGETIQFTKGIVGEEQSFQYWNGYIIIASTLPESIIIIKADTGEQVSYISLAEKYGFLRTAECESAFIINNHIYFSNNSRVTPTPDGVTNLEFSLFRCDFMNPKGEWYDYWLKKTYQSHRGGTIFVSGDKPTESSVSSDGSEDLPYWFVEDALLSYTTDKRLHFSSETFLKNLGITFTKESYNHRIYIENMSNVLVGLNGYGSSKTTVPCIFAHNSKLSINRLIIEGTTDQSITLSSFPISIYSNLSNIRVLDTVEFTNESEDRIDVFATTLSNVNVEGSVYRVIAYQNSVIDVYRTERMGKATGGKVYTKQVAHNTNIFEVSAGASDTSRWINFVTTNNKMYRLFLEASQLRLEYYPDATQVDTGQHQTVWTIPATLP